MAIDIVKSFTPIIVSDIKGQRNAVNVLTNLQCNVSICCMYVIRCMHICCMYILYYACSMYVCVCNMDMRGLPGM